MVVAKHEIARIFLLLVSGILWFIASVIIYRIVSPVRDVTKGGI